MQKSIYHGICILMTILLAFGLWILPTAASTDASDGEDGAVDFANLTWEEIVEEFLSRSPGRPENVGIAYYNTVTGEYHAYHGDQYYQAASLYKLPLNMYFAEKISLGEMTMDDRIFGSRYGDIQRASLQFSSNPESEMLQGYLGGMDEYIDAIRPYVADEGDDYDRTQMRRIAFTPNQMLHALKLLYAEPERYPDVLYYLGEAEQDNFFCKYEDRFSIAHKYGWIAEEWLTVVNDAGIIRTDEPILLVFMSNNNTGDTVTIGQFCVLMCDYCQYWHSVHQAEAKKTVAAEAEPPQSTVEAVAELVEDAEIAPEEKIAGAAEETASELPANAVSESAVQMKEQPAFHWLLLIPVLVGACLGCLRKKKR